MLPRKELRHVRTDGTVAGAGGGVKPNAVDVVRRVNGETKQSSNTEQFIFRVDELIANISE